MLPDFVKVREPINEVITITLRQLVYQRPLIASIRHEHYFEGHAYGGYGEAVDEETHGFRRFETPSVIPTEELIERGPDALAARLPQLANAMADQLGRRMLERMKEAAETDQTGYVGTAGPAMTCVEFLARLEEMKIDFDGDGNAIMPMIVGDPAMIGRLREWHDDAECQARLAELLVRKREEFDARESNRALVD